MTKILDSSALIAAFKQAKGAKDVEDVMASSVMSSVNVAEVLTVLSRHNIGIAEARKYIDHIIKGVIDFTQEDAEIAASIAQKTKHLSLGDRACIALGIRLKGTIYSADKIWANLSLGGVKIHIIR